MPVKRIQRLISVLWLVLAYKVRNSCKPARGNKADACVLHAFQHGRSRKQGCADRFYTPMTHGLLDTAAVFQDHNRTLQSWRVPKAEQARLHGMVQGEAIHCFGVAEMKNTDLGSQFTLFVLVDWLKRAGSQILTGDLSRSIAITGER